MIGQTLGHYHILEKIGAGGMGVVYRARDQQLDRDVAIKVLTQTSFTEGRARLLREARAAAALNHPHICTIHEVGEAGTQAYIAMEFVEGQALSARLAAGALPAEEVLRYGLHLAEALAHAHERGVVHCDLKSANVVITPEGRAKVLDFGLAKRLSGEELAEATTQSQVYLTQRGALVGTLAYMPPEVLRGQPADARADVWALGVVLYEMTAGARPFRGETGFELSSEILSQPPPPLPATVPPGFRRVIARCLCKEPAERYQRAGEVRGALEALRSATRVPVERLPRKPARKRIRALAVLPLENLSHDPEQEYFADGMTEALTTHFAKIGALKVISRTSAMQYKGAKKPLREIVQELGVDAVVEGSVLRAGNRVRITAQLINAADQHLWAESYNRDLRDILELQSEVAQAIAQEIRIKLTAQERARLAPRRLVNPAAYEAYLLGRFHWNKRTEAALQKSIECFEQAIQRDPSHAPAYSGLADAYHMLGSAYTVGLMSPAEAFARAKTAAQKALEIDELLAEAHTSLAAVRHGYEWDWTGALAEYERALQLNPSYATARQWYAELLAALGRLERAIAEIKRAQELDPLSLPVHATAASIFYFARQYNRAIEECRKTLEMDPNFALAHVYLGLAYEQKSMLTEAVAAFEGGRILSGGSPPARAALGHVYGIGGNRDKARELLDQLSEPEERSFVPAYLRAKIHIALGEKEEALVWLEKAQEERSDWLLYVQVDPILEPLRPEPRFQALLRRMNFPE